jgi:hypothetical protein
LADDRPFAELEKECQILAQLNDAPVWSIGSYRGVISKIDPLHAIAGVVTSDEHLNRRQVKMRRYSIPISSALEI